MLMTVFHTSMYYLCVQIRWVYRAVCYLTDLFFAVDKDLDNLPDKRISKQTKEEAPAAGETV